MNFKFSQKIYKGLGNVQTKNGKKTKKKQKSY